MKAAKPVSPKPNELPADLADLPDFQLEDEATDEVEIGHVMSRPDGYHWQTPDGKQEFGPFNSMEDAIADMQLAAGESVEPGETLQEAEDEIGIADWIDQDTGGPAEGLSSPRLHDE